MVAQTHPAVAILAEQLHNGAVSASGHPPWAQASPHEREEALAQAQWITYPWCLALLHEKGFDSLAQVTEKELANLLFEGLLSFADREHAIAQGWDKTYLTDAQNIAQALQAAGLLA